MLEKSRHAEKGWVGVGEAVQKLFFFLAAPNSSFLQPSRANLRYSFPCGERSKFWLIVNCHIWKKKPQKHSLSLPKFLLKKTTWPHVPPPPPKKKNLSVSSSSWSNFQFFFLGSLLWLKPSNVKTRSWPSLPHPPRLPEDAVVVMCYSRTPLCGWWTRDHQVCTLVLAQLLPNHQRWCAKNGSSVGICTLRTDTFCAELRAQSLLLNEISASEPSQKFTKSALLVG